MITPQVHCLLDCLSLGLQERRGIDIRPAYIGAWNAPFVADEHGFSYFSDTIDPDLELTRFERIYGKCIDRWQNPLWSKEEKFAAMERAAEEGGARTVMVLVDLYYLPYSAICYGLKHFPHIVIVERQEERDWLLRDPFFEWEGPVPHTVLLQALTCEQLSAGISLQAEAAQEPAPETVSALFREQFDRTSRSPLMEGVDRYMKQIAEGAAGYSVEALFATIGQVGIVAKRWKAFGVIAGYFAEMSDASPDPALRALELLLLRWENFVLAIVRLGVLNRLERLPDAQDKLLRLEALETEVRAELWKLFERWEATCHEVLA